LESVSAKEFTEFREFEDGSCQSSAHASLPSMKQAFWDKSMRGIEVLSDDNSRFCETVNAAIPLFAGGGLEKELNLIHHDVQTLPNSLREVLL
jgi:hypothetical protein